MIRLKWIVFSGLLLTGLAVISGYASDITPEDFEKLPVSGMVTMIDLGAKKCIPCKMMAPIMEKWFQDRLFLLQRKTGVSEILGTSIKI